MPRVIISIVSDITYSNSLVSSNIRSKTTTHSNSQIADDLLHNCTPLFSWQARYQNIYHMAGAYSVPSMSMTSLQNTVIYDTSCFTEVTSVMD